MSPQPAQNAQRVLPETAEPSVFEKEMLLNAMSVAFERVEKVLDMSLRARKGVAISD